MAGLSAVAAALLVCVAAGSLWAAVKLSNKNETITQEKEAAVAAKKLAQDKEAEAAKNAVEAAEQAGIALGALQTLIDKVQNRLDDTPGTEQLKRDLLEVAIKEVQKVSSAAEKSTSIEATRAAGLMRLGHLFRQLGNSEEAMKQFRSVYEITKARVVLKQGSDASRQNLAAALLMLAEMDKEAARDLQLSLAHNKEALAIWEDIDQHPKTDEKGEGLADKAKVKEALAEVNTRVGATYLRLGDIPRAGPYFHKALALRRERFTAAPTEARS